jgi:hypothetical protein
LNLPSKSPWKVIDDRGLSPFSASGQIIASVNCRRADNHHAMAACSERFTRKEPIRP